MTLNLFLSSTVRDLKNYRRAVREACLHKAETACLLGEEDWSGGYDDTVAKCEQRVQQANAFMLLAGYWYGSIAPGKDRSITHIEFDEARKKWKDDKFPPMAVLMPAQGSPAAKKLRLAAQTLMREAKANVDIDSHERAINAFHAVLTGSWRTVDFFKDKNDLREIAIARCCNWNGQTPLAAARGQVLLEKNQTAARVSDEQLGLLGRKFQLGAAKAALSRVADYADVPGIAMLVHGDDDAGQRAFLQSLIAIVLKKYLPRQRLSRLPLQHNDSAILPGWVAQRLGLSNSRGVKTPEQLAECLAPELKRQPMYFVLDRISDIDGGLAAFRDNFWRPLYLKLHELRTIEAFDYRLVAIVSDYSGVDAPWKSATWDLNTIALQPDFSAILRLPKLEPFSRNDILDWLEDLEIPDEPAGRRSRLADRMVTNGRGEGDTVPIRVFERLQGETLWPEELTNDRT
jgi:hypothetical protein